LLPDAEAMIDFLYVDDVEIDDASWAKATKDPAVARAMLDAIIDAYGSVDWTADALHAAMLAVAEQQGLKLGKAQAPIRVAVTGRSVGPPLFESLAYLGRDETLDRLRAALQRLPG
jgi:glutamyl-tRNA synthetase